MDDLDHSIQIAEYDWTCFCEESEECSLLKPSLACPDSSGLSDSEDSESSTPVQLNKSRTGGGGQDEKSLMQLDPDVRSVCSAGNILNTTEVHAEAAEETKATDNGTELSNRLKKEVRRLETEVDNSRNGPDEPHATEAALGRVQARTEEERWFVTVSDRSAGQQAAASSVRQKPPGQISSSKQQKCAGKIKDDNDSEGGRDTRGFVQLKQTPVPQSGDAPSAKTNQELRQMCSKDETMSEVLLITNSPAMGGNTHQAVSHDAFGLNEPSQAEELDFCSTHSLFAAESAEEPLYRHEDHVTESQQLLATSHPPNTSDAQDRGLYYCDSSPATRCEGSGGTGAEPTPAFPSADHGADKMPDDSSTCDEDAGSAELCVSSDSPALQDPEIHLSASGGSSGRQRSPDVNATPCSVAGGSEAAGLTGPVYAVSAFWNEMEKLTINDILRLRMGRTTPRDPTQGTVTPGGHALPVNHTFHADAVECNSSDEPTDASDFADSDYFTQPDESKPDCSSCGFSTSDLEEEYWHFTGASRNPSPDPLDNNHPRTSGSPFLSHGELWCTWSPVPPEDRSGQSLDPHNVQAPDTEELTSQSSLADNESSPFPSPSPALEPLTPTPALSSTDTPDKHYQISIPELFEYFFTEDEADNDTCGTVELFLNAHSEDGDISPVRALPPSSTRADDSKAGGSRAWQTLLSIKRICFHSKGSTWCRRSGAWVLPVDAEKASEKREDPPSTAVAEGRERWRIWETLHTRKKKSRAKVTLELVEMYFLVMILRLSGQEGVLSTLKQSDMCLVCIAFASWVLRSSNPEAADAWKAALLANVSALSAIRFLRQYVKKTPLQDDP